MNSIVRKQTGFGKGLAAAVLAAAMMSALPAKALTVGGSIAPINEFSAFGNTGLDIDAANAAFKTIGTIYVSNNMAGGFTLTATATNGSFNKKGHTALATLTGLENPYTALQLTAGTPAGGTLGTAGVAGTIVPPDGVGAATGLGTVGLGALSTAHWISGTQETATDGYSVDLQAKWAANTTLLAGLYTDKWTISLVGVF